MLMFVSAQMSCLCMLTGIVICMYIICIYDMHMYDIYISIYAFTQGFSFPLINTPKIFGIFLIHTYYENKSISFQHQLAQLEYFLC